MLFNTSLLPHKRQIQQQILRFELQGALLVHRQAKVRGFVAHVVLAICGVEKI